MSDTSSNIREYVVFLLVISFVFGVPTWAVFNASPPYDGIVLGAVLVIPLGILMLLFLAGLACTCEHLFSFPLSRSGSELTLYGEPVVGYDVVDGKTFLLVKTETGLRAQSVTPGVLVRRRFFGALANAGIPRSSLDREALNSAIQRWFSDPVLRPLVEDAGLLEPNFWLGHRRRIQQPALRRRWRVLYNELWKRPAERNLARMLAIRCFLDGSWYFDDMDDTEPNDAITILYVTDLARSVEFYDRVFGFQKTVDVPVYVEYRMNFGSRLGLMLCENTKQFLGNELAAMIPTDGAPKAELYLRFDSVDEIVTDFERVGARCISTLQSRDWGDRAAYYLDPDGYVLAVATQIESHDDRASSGS